MICRTYSANLKFLYKPFIFSIWDDDSVNKLEGWVTLTGKFNKS